MNRFQVLRKTMLFRVFISVCFCQLKKIAHVFLRLGRHRGSHPISCIALAAHGGFLVQKELNTAKVACSNLGVKFTHTDLFLRMSKVLNDNHESLIMFSI